MKTVYNFVFVLVMSSYTTTILTSPVTPEIAACSGEHEQYSECNRACARNCTTFGLKDYSCDDTCMPGCTCVRGFIRNKEGACVNPQQCENDVCPAKNEEFSECVSPCGETCRDLGHHITCNFLVCNQGCDCKPGFYRNGDGTCVPPEECDCGGEGTNQVLDLCHNSCPSESCTDIGKMFKCAVPEVCKPACKCKLNYKRDSSRQCVGIRDCPQPFQCGPREEYTACPEFCQDERCVQEPLLPCASIRLSHHICRPECRCQGGYCRDGQGMCVDNLTSNKEI